MAATYAVASSCSRPAPVAPPPAGRACRPTGPALPDRRFASATLPVWPARHRTTPTPRTIGHVALRFVPTTPGPAPVPTAPRPPARRARPAETVSGLAPTGLPLRPSVPLHEELGPRRGGGGVGQRKCLGIGVRPPVPFEELRRDLELVITIARRTLHGLRERQPGRGPSRFKLPVGWRVWLLCQRVEDPSPRSSVFWAAA